MLVVFPPSSLPQARKKNSVNGFVLPTEKLKHDTLDALALSASMFVDLVGQIPALFKAK